MSHGILVQQCCTDAARMSWHALLGSRTLEGVEGQPSVRREDFGEASEEALLGGRLAQRCYGQAPSASLEVLATQGGH